MSGRMIGSKPMGCLSDNQEIDKLRPLKLTKMCNIPIVNDLTNESVICFAGDLVLVNVVQTTLNTNFAVDQSFEVLWVEKSPLWLMIGQRTQLRSLFVVKNRMTTSWRAQGPLKYSH